MKERKINEGKQDKKGKRKLDRKDGSRKGNKTGTR
jgi:hypothetical protein